MVSKYFKDHPEIWDKRIATGVFEAFRSYCPIKAPDKQLDLSGYKELLKKGLSDDNGKP